MYCTNCGKTIKDHDRFCRYCGFNTWGDEPQTGGVYAEEALARDAELMPEISDIGEEVVLYVLQKHWMGVLLPVVIMPIFVLVFWKVYVHASSMLGAMVGILFLFPVIYPIFRYASDSIVFTNKYVHIKRGLFEIQEIDVPITKTPKLLRVERTFLSGIADYGYIVYKTKDGRKHYIAAADPSELEMIIENPVRFVNDALACEE